jgi:hypothetical protein
MQILVKYILYINNKVHRSEAAENVAVINFRK